MATLAGGVETPNLVWTANFGLAILNHKTSIEKVSEVGDRKAPEVSVTTGS